MPQGSWVVADGIYVLKKHRGKGIPVMLRDVLYPYLTERGYNIFDMGSSESPILDGPEPQGLAKRDVREGGDAVFNVHEGDDGKIEYYSVYVDRFPPTYDTSKVELA
jgi:GNAT superfamily N-acetyltransferase